MDDAPIDKAKILEQLVQELDNELRQLRVAYEEARRTSVEAPGRMQSRYDTMGIEAAWVADGLAKNFEEKTLALQTLRQSPLPEKPERVTLGCIVGVGPRDGSVDALFFILPACGGMVVSADGADLKVQIVTPSTPIGRGLIRKLPGEVVSVRRNRTEPDCVLLIL